MSLQAHFRQTPIVKPIPKVENDIRDYFKPLPMAKDHGGYVHILKGLPRHRSIVGKAPWERQLIMANYRKSETERQVFQWEEQRLYNESAQGMIEEARRKQLDELKLNLEMKVAEKLTKQTDRGEKRRMKLVAYKQLTHWVARNQEEAEHMFT